MLRIGAFAAALMALPVLLAAWRDDPHPRLGELQGLICSAYEHPAAGH